MGKFFISKRTNGEYRFILKADNHETILTSEGYQTKAGCKNGIESVKMNAPFDQRYDRRVATNGQYYFNLKASNGEIIGTSEMYTTFSGREAGIESVKRNAPNAPIIDLTGE